MEVHRLSEEVAAFVQSGAAISDATQCVLELVFNSLDASASSIAIRVNLKKFFIQVVDNGVGATEHDLAKLGERYMTNKCKNVEELESIIETFGYRGSALASIKDVCEKMEIQSRHHIGKETFTLELNRDGKVKFYENETIRPAHGMTVTITDLMCSLPVRRKRIKEVFDLDDIVHQIEALAVIHCGVSFSVRNDSVGKVLLQTHRHDDPRETLSEIFGLSLSKQLIPIANGRGKVRVSGFVSKELHSNTDLQLVYVNQRIVNRSKIHKLVLNILKKYGGFWEKDRDKSDEVIDVEGYIFIVKIQCPYPSYTLSRNGRNVSVEFRNCEDVLKCVHRAVAQSLKDGRLESSPEETVPDLMELDKPKGPGFGPSQLQNAVQGRRVVRPVENLGQVVSVPEVFFGEISGDGTALPENAPVFDIPDFPQCSFHDFLAWLKLQSFNDAKAAKFLSEFSTVKPLNSEPQAAAPIVSLKQIRKEKFDNWNRIMLKKIEDSRKINPLKENSFGVRKIVHRETTTYTRTPKWSSTSNIKNLPQVTFHEFLAWMKYKANHDNTASQMLKGFFTWKGQSEKLQLKRINEVCCENRMKKFKACHELKTPGRKEVITLSKGIQCSLRLPIHKFGPTASPLYTTWASHNQDRLNAKNLSTPEKITTPYLIPNENHRSPEDCGNYSDIEINLSSPAIVVSHKEVQVCPVTKSSFTQTISKIKKLANVAVQTEERNISVTNEYCQTSCDSNFADTVAVSYGNEELGNYFNTNPGFSGFMPPAMSTRNTFGFVENTQEIIPSLLQEKVEELQVVLADSCQDHLASVKWGGCSEDQIEKRLAEIHQITKSVISEPPIMSAKLPKSASKVEAVISSISFEKEDLESVKIIGQVDRKFIGIILRKLLNDGRFNQFLCLIDQHAAHERITLETLLQQYTSMGKIEMEELEYVFPLTVSKSTFDIFNNNKAQFLDCGILADALGTSALLVRGVPACFIRREEREVKFSRQSSLKTKVADLVDELAEHLMITRGARITTPKTIINVIASEACRSAIKFNQSLSYEEMVHMVNQLQECQFPFQCAHGRPSIVPVFKIEDNLEPYRPVRQSYLKFKKT